jgi:hypothetical protein
MDDALGMSRRQAFGQLYAQSARLRLVERSILQLSA